MPNYIEAIAKGFLGIQCHALGNGSDYDTLVLDVGEALPSKAELDAYIASVSYDTTPIDYSKMPDGTPTFLYIPDNRNISVSHTMVQFCTKTNAAKNFYLDYGTLTTSPTIGYVPHAHEIITSISFNLSKIAAQNVTAYIRSGETNLTQVTITSGTNKVLVKDLAILLDELDTISCFVESIASFANPNVICQIHRRIP